MTVLRWMFALMLTAAMPSAALAQDATDEQGGNQGKAIISDPPAFDDSLEQNTGEQPYPVQALQGLWHVDHVEGSAANDTMSGSLLKIDRAAITSLSAGTCTNPVFTVMSQDAILPPAPGLPVGINIECLGQVFAAATIDLADRDTVNWVESPGLQAVLHRVKSATTAVTPALEDNNNDSGEGDDAQ